LSASAIRTGDEGAAAVVVSHDTTELRQAAETLRQREASFRLMFAANPHPMWVYDLETLEFLEVNAAAIARCGDPREEFLAMRIPQLQPATEPEQHAWRDSTGA